MVSLLYHIHCLNCSCIVYFVIFETYSLSSLAAKFLHMWLGCPGNFDFLWLNAKSNMVMGIHQGFSWGSSHYITPVVESSIIML